MTMAKQWKQGQLKAIDWRSGEMIVSASAGTGKTSVIIERAWQIVQQREANVDELMIVTFTEDAAEELKTRLLNRLDAEFSSAHDSDQRAYLRDQLHRLDRAQISTIHSMCRRIVRENYNLLKIGDLVEIMPPVQAALLKHQLMDELLESAYADAGDFGGRFLRLVECYGGNIDSNISATILHLHEFLNSLADPDGWRAETKKLATTYRNEMFDISELPAYQYLKETWLTGLKGVESKLTQIETILLPHGHTKANEYLQSLIGLARQWQRIIAAGNIETTDSTMPRSPIIKKEEDKLWWIPIRDRIDAAKETLKEVAGEYEEAVTPNLREILQKQADLIETILELQERFAGRLDAAKAEKEQLEFDDLQRLTIKVLLEHPEVTGRYREQFRFVMVDEYQDINELQDKIIRLVSRPDETTPDRCANLFMVGDVKQSIYRFRQAEPEIFQSLYRLADANKNLNRIDLADNFRSRREVLDAVNSVFEPILGGGEVELEYDEGSRLVCGASYPQANQSPKAELHILERNLDAADVGDSDSENDLAEMEAIHREAWLLARRIRELIDARYPVSVGGEVRSVQPDDIVILLRSLRSTAGTYIAMLRRLGLNAYCSQVEAFLEYPEIADMVSLLTIIDNPFHDIPLAAVLRSPFVGATPDELAEVKLAAGRDHFYTGLVRYAEENPLHPAGRKFGEFLGRCEEWRRMAGASSVGELVQRIYLETHYPERIRSQNPEASGAENLEEFLGVAWQFSGDSGNDLRDFLDYLEMLSERSEAIPSVQAGAGSGVRLMTVHASKGLEFPVVVLGNIGRKMNLMDLRRDILIDRNLLIGMKDVQPLGIGKTNTLPVMAISKRSRNQSLAEELRLLYVAMTRAKEKLIMIGTAKTSSLIKTVESSSAEAGRVSPAMVAQRDNSLAWISLAMASNASQKAKMLELLTTESQAEVEFAAMKVHFYPPAVQLAWNMTASQQTPKEKTSAADLLSKIVEADSKISSEAREKIDRVLHILDWKYPQEHLCRMPTHFSVTDLTQRADAYGALDVTEGDLMARPKILLQNTIRLPDEDAQKPLERGTAWHKLMEKIDLASSLEEEGIRSQIESLFSKKILTKAQAEMIDPYKVARFFISPPGRLMQQYRDRMYRELPFTFLLPRALLPKELKMMAVDEPILIQGVIDCLIKTDTSLVIIDYKTNDITAGEVDRLTDHYRTQINLYAVAMGEILQDRVAEAWLYFSQPDSAVRVI
jgi:ATP-dependent helicase/nuclease subunit A